MKEEENFGQGSPELRKRLPRGGIQVLATKYQVTWQWTHKVVTGKFRGDPRMLRDAHRMAEIEDIRRAEMDEIFERRSMEINLA